MNKFASLLTGCISAAALTTAIAAGAPGAGTGMAASGSANPDQEIGTALQHAGMSAGSTKLADVHAHLHHVLNCLVGPSGQGYDSTAEDPCKGQGTGAINDVQNKSKERGELDDAVKEANKGLKENKLKKAQKYAKKVMEELQDAQKDAKKGK
ncbi:MAG TPA: hypothetical protein VLV87_02765 [Gammaproteobacteria bacterium]|nr:hypothetical protein [Gammaproteobacteria bacterium]